MYEEIIKKIVESIEEKPMPANIYPKLSGDGYKAFKIDVKNFHRIKKIDSDKKIAFVDAGNAEIIGSANFSLNLVRVCYVVYQRNKKTHFRKFETLAFVHSISQNNEIYYKASFFKIKDSLDFEEISLSSFDSTLTLGVNRAEVGIVANAIRRFAELKAARLIADEKTADVVVLDGNLQGTFTNEGKYLNELYESCSKSNVILASLSKTSALFTDNGDLLGVILGNLGTFSSWFYYPVVEISNPSHQAEMFFVKFHDKSRYVFRFEIFNKQKSSAEETINILANNCMDPVFIGYPYGLVEADRIARVSKSEKESLKTMLLIRLKNMSIEKYLGSVNAHEILDRISF